MTRHRPLRYLLTDADGHPREIERFIVGTFRVLRVEEGMEGRC